jgi:hypothetical protein
MEKRKCGGWDTSRRWLLARIKIIEQPDRSAVVEGSKIPDFMRERILVRMRMNSYDMLR